MDSTEEHVDNTQAEEEAARQAAEEEAARQAGQGRPGPTNQLELGRMDYAQKMKNFRARQDLEAKGYKGAMELPDYVQVSYGKRRRRRRSFGKKAKKPSAALKRMCKKHKVRLTLKRGGKRVYKSEAMLKKQCKTAMKRKKKK